MYTTENNETKKHPPPLCKHPEARLAVSLSVWGTTAQSEPITTCQYKCFTFFKQFVVACQEGREGTGVMKIVLFEYTVCPGSLAPFYSLLVYYINGSTLLGHAVRVANGPGVAPCEH